MDTRSRRPRQKIRYQESSDEEDTETSIVNEYDHIAEVLALLSPDEISRWKGWIEVESEPIVFDAIIQDIGALNAQIQEVFTMDNLSTMGDKVIGLIFLSEFENDNGLQEEVPDSPQVWFANQTEDNSCATVAMLNIIMNSKHVRLSDRLIQLKKATKDMDSVTRGKVVGESSFLRIAHNQFASRMDILNEDLSLDNRVDFDADGKMHLDRNLSKSRCKQPRDAVFHFIAYVVCDGEVWELDGLRFKPMSIGKVQKDVSWLEVAKPAIETRMSMDESRNFSLLSLVDQQNPSYLCQALADLTAVERYLDGRTEIWNRGGILQSPIRCDDVKALASYHITPQQILKTAISDCIVPLISKGTSIEDAKAVRSAIICDRIMPITNEKARTVLSDDKSATVSPKGHDFLPAIHAWVKELAAMDKLQDLQNITTGGPTLKQDGPSPAKKQKRKH